MRRMPVSRRMMATMSCEVGPTGLSRLMTPSMASCQLALADREQLRARVVELGLDRASGRARVSPTSELAGDCHGVRLLGGSHRYADPLRLRLLEEHDDVGPAGESHEVDEPFRRAR